ncbi:MAG: hypothetical protein A4S17_01360 [Proteobacteria bacterium HN_bin10]|nr:MAG: hypothetical protein A4S17_01360 [Proteobacteria bacterium HN_bin10]
MLRSTFVILKGIGEHTERRLWESGIADWETFLAADAPLGMAQPRKTLYDADLTDALAHFHGGRGRYFAGRLKPRDHWRLYESFRQAAVYLDIETTGEPADAGEITVVGLYADGQVTQLVRGETLTADRLHAELSSRQLLVTFAGSLFDVPYLRAKFPGLALDLPHFDLCFAARRLGLKGGLKQIEPLVGLAREDTIRGMDGWEAVRLWHQWRRGDREARERLLTYNRADTVNLEPLAEHLFHRLRERLASCPAG